jgi:hypothetical protein
VDVAAAVSLLRSKARGAAARRRSRERKRLHHTSLILIIYSLVLSISHYSFYYKLDSYSLFTRSLIFIMRIYFHRDAPSHHPQVTAALQHAGAVATDGGLAWVDITC